MKLQFFIFLIISVWTRSRFVLQQDDCIPICYRRIAGRRIADGCFASFLPQSRQLSLKPGDGDALPRTCCLAGVSIGIESVSNCAEYPV